MIDAERLAVAWLAADPDVGARVSTLHPSSLEEPWVLVRLIDDRPDPSTSALAVGTAYLQVDCYAGTGGSQATARDLARAARARLHAMDGAHDQGVVYAVTGLSIRPQPDTDMNPAGERFIVEAQVYARG